MSLNDPQWGKRNRTGPPDLEEIWRNVNRRLNTIFGRKEPEGGDGGPPPTKSSFPIGGAGMVSALVVVIWLASGFYIVDEGRRGVVTRFGKYTETTTPGTSPSSISWSIRANVSVNSYGEKVTLAKLA